MRFPKIGYFTHNLYSISKIRFLKYANECFLKKLPIKLKNLVGSLNGKHLAAYVHSIYLNKQLLNLFDLCRDNSSTNVNKVVACVCQRGSADQESARQLTIVWPKVQGILEQNLKSR